MGMFDIDISISDKRSSEIRSIMLSGNIKISSSGAVYIKSGDSHFFPSSFLIENDDVVIYIDPLKIENPKIADYILITHSHPDHLSLEDIKNVSDSNTVLICPLNVTGKLSGFNIELVRPKDNINLENVHIEVVPAYSKGFPTHPKFSKNVGYVLNIDGVRIYHAGDTDKIKEIEGLENIDIALVPIDGGVLTMSTQEAASLINKLNPKIAVPMHYVVDKDKAIEFRSLINENIEVMVFAN